MCKAIVIIAVVLFSNSVQSQIYEPVKWTTSVEEISSYEFYLIATAEIEGEWHLYSQNVPKGGPIPTTFTSEKNNRFKLVSTVEEEEVPTIDDPIFNMRIKYLRKRVVFKQRIKSSKLNKIIGFVEFMICNDTQCLPPTEVDLEFKIK